jgi:hypothetical protein
MLDLPDAVRRIGDKAFVGCGGLTEVRMGEGISDWGVEPFAGGKHTVEELRVRGSSMENVPGALLHPALAFDAVLVVGGRERFCYASSAAHMLSPDRVVTRLPGFARQFLRPAARVMGQLEILARRTPDARSLTAGAWLRSVRFTNACYLALVRTDMSLAIATMAANLFDELGFKCFFTQQTRADVFKKNVQVFVETTDRVLVVVFCGESSESGGQQQMEFEDRVLKRSEIGAFLRTVRKPARPKLVFLCDCGFPGGAYSLDPSGTLRGAIELSARGDCPPGAFTYFLCRQLRAAPATGPSMLVPALEDSLEAAIGQDATVGLEMTSWYAYDRPLLTEMHDPAADSKADNWVSFDEDTGRLSLVVPNPLVRGLIASYAGRARHVVVRGAPRMEEGLFSGFSVLESVDLRKCTATVIPAGAFENCELLNRTGLPPRAMRVGACAFARCLRLTSLGASALESVGASAFDGCAKFEGEVRLDSSIQSIGQRAFAGCERLTRLVLGKSLKSMGESARDGCAGLVGEIVLPPAIEAVESRMFAGCCGLTRLELGPSVKSIGESAWEGCSGLGGDLVFGNMTTSVGARLRGL